jgi:hypothetical protein
MRKCVTKSKGLMKIWRRSGLRMVTAGGNLVFEATADRALVKLL